MQMEKSCHFILKMENDNTQCCQGYSIVSTYTGNGDNLYNL